MDIIHGTNSKIHSTMPEQFPLAWASEWGIDKREEGDEKGEGDTRYDLWMSFTYANITQRMRWIKPGRFMMGSPTKEAEKDNSDSWDDLGFQVHLVSFSYTFLIRKRIAMSFTNKKQILLREIEGLPLSKLDEFIDIIHNFKEGIKKTKKPKGGILEIFGICKENTEWDEIAKTIYEEREKNYRTD